MGLVDYSYCQSKPKAKFTNKFDEEFAVAKINSNCDSIAVIYLNSSPPNCQSQHLNAVNSTHSARATNTHQINHTKMLSALNSRTHQLLISNSANAAQIQLH